MKRSGIGTVAAHAKIAAARDAASEPGADEVFEPVAEAA